jgi:hypothetical protein
VGAGPFEAGLADADAVAPRLAIVHDEIEEAVVGIDDDGAGPFLGLILDHLRQELRLDATANGGHARIDRRDRLGAGARRTARGANRPRCCTMTGRW